MPRRFALFFIGSVLAAQFAPRFERLAEFSAAGGAYASTIGPARTPGKEALYTTYTYTDDTFDLVATDPETGQQTVFTNPIQGEYGARSMVLGPDQSLYVGTLPHAHLLRFNPTEGRLIDLGRPSPDATFLWSLAAGKDGKIYGGTFPNARLIRFDPRTGKLEDLLRADPIESYVRYLAAGADGFIYCGIGSAHMGVAAYNTRTGVLTQILPANLRTAGFCQVFQAESGEVYATAGDLRFRLKDGIATPVPPRECPPPRNPGRMKNGSSVTISDRKLQVINPKQPSLLSTPKILDYAGRHLNLFRMGLGPDHMIYLNSEIPARFSRFDPKSGLLQELGQVGSGELYSFLSYGNRLLMGGYATVFRLLAFDPTKPFDLQAKNPQGVSIPGVDESWRPYAATRGPQGDTNVYFGGIPGYGKMGGPLVAWNPNTGQTVVDYPIHNQSVSSLAVWKNLIIGSTDINGSVGTKPTEKNAVLFQWDPKARRVLWEGAPVEGASGINNLVVTPEGLVYGLAANNFFVFDLTSHQIRYRRPLPFNGGTIYNSLLPGPDGRLWGLSPIVGVFAIDPRTYKVTTIGAPPSASITGGAALDGHDLYFICGAALYKYRIP
jgi:hypothetical protein